MHIFMTSEAFDPILPYRMGAIGSYVYGLSRELSYENSVDVFGIGTGRRKIGKLNIETLRYNKHIMKIFQMFLGPLHSRGVLFNAYLLKKILSLHKAHPIDIIHIHSLYSGFSATICKLCLGVPVVCSLHNTVRTTLPIQTCDKILANSEYTRRSVIENKHLESSKLDVLPIAVDTSKYKPLEKKGKAKNEIGLSDSKVVLFVGRKRLEKGPQVLVEALPMILNRIPETVAVFIGPDYYFGSDSKLYQTVQKRYNFDQVLTAKATKLKVENRVILKDFVPERVLIRYYNAADVVVFPSIWQEPFGTVVLEALACEKPVVASNVGGIPEIVSTKVNGILVQPNDRESLATEVTYLLQNPKFAKQLGRNGRNVVLKRFSFEVVAKKCLGIYENILRK